VELGVDFDTPDTSEKEVEDVLGRDWWRQMGRNNTSTNANSSDDNNSSSNSEAKYSLSFEQFLELSNKMVLLFNIIAQSTQHEDKVIVFSQSLCNLNLIEMLLGQRDWGKVLLGDNSRSSSSSFPSCWTKGKDYLRIDGSVSNRQPLIDNFNSNPRVKLMLISTKAGNMGINLQAANRIVIFDCSWNPAHDLQAIFRAYRFGQKKNVFVYRLVAGQSMEEKIHKRQVIKETLAARVVDAQMPDNHFTEKEHTELLELNENEVDEALEAELDAELAAKAVNEASGPNDVITLTPEQRKQRLHQLKQNLLQQKVLSVVGSGIRDEVLLKCIERIGLDNITSIEDHESLLEDNEDEHLNTDEQAVAKEEYNQEKNIRSGIIPRSASSNQVDRPPPPVMSVPTGWDQSFDILLMSFQQIFEHDRTLGETTKQMNSYIVSKNMSAMSPSFYSNRYNFLIQSGEHLTQAEVINGLIQTLKGPIMAAFAKRSTSS
jgi:transcriptional regulator ATRX